MTPYISASLVTCTSMQLVADDKMEESCYRHHHYEEHDNASESDQTPDMDGWGLASVFMTPAALGFLYGFDLGATSFVLAHLFMKQHHHHTHDHEQAMQVDGVADDDLDATTTSGCQFWWTVDNFDHSWKRGWFIATLSLGAWFGSHLVFLLTHPAITAQSSSRHGREHRQPLSQYNKMCHYFCNMGRRRELQICAILYVLGTTANVLSGTVLAYSSPVVGFAVLIMGRLLFGMGVGFIMHGAPAYMAEMCPDQVRGAVVTAKEAMIVSGILVGYAVGNGLLGNPQQSKDHVDDKGDDLFLFGGRWTAVYFVMLVTAIPLLLLSLFVIPESHRWLLRQGRLEEALDSLKFVYRTDTDYNDDRVMDLWERLVQSDRSAKTKSTKTTVDCHKDTVDYDDENDCQDSNLPTSMVSFLMMLWSNHPSAFMAAMGLILFQQLSAQPCILSYAPVIWNAAGWNGNASVVTALIMLSTAMGTVMLVDVIGRKHLLKTCCATMATALFLLAVCFWHENDDHEQAEMANDSRWTGLRQWLIVVGMFAYVAGYQIGFGPITWLVVSEVFPMHVRGPAIAAGVELNYLLNFMVQFVLAGMQDKMGWGPTFLVFGLVVATAFVYIHHYVPETKGLSLEDIQTEMTKHYNARRGGIDEKSTLLDTNNGMFHYMTMSTSLSDFDQVDEGTSLSLDSSDSIDL